MLFGTYLGGYWILKFILFPLGLTTPFLSFLFMGLTICVPFMGYYYVRMYRNTACGGSISFLHAWIFTVFMYMFAALLTAMAHYIYFRFIDHGFVINAYESQIDILKQKWRTRHRSLCRCISRDTGQCKIAHPHRHYHAIGVMERVLRFAAGPSHRLIRNETQERMTSDGRFQINQA